MAMGSRGAKGGDEFDAFCPHCRRLLCRFGRPGVASSIKARFWRRTRRKARRVTLQQAEEA